MFLFFFHSDAVLLKPTDKPVVKVSHGSYWLFAIVAGFLAGIFLLGCLTCSFMFCSVEYKLKKAKAAMKRRSIY